MGVRIPRRDGTRTIIVDRPIGDPPPATPPRPNPALLSASGGDTRMTNEFDHMRRMGYRTLSERIRDEVRDLSAPCPTCGQPRNKRGLRHLAAEIGIPHTVLWRFMKGGAATTDTLDRIDTWLHITRKG